MFKVTTFSKKNDFFLHILNEIMQYFQNTIINSKIVVVENAIIIMIAMQKLIHRNRDHENVKKVENVNRNVRNKKRNEIVCSDSNKTIVSIKTIEYCNHCKKRFHIYDEFKGLHFELII